MYRYIGFVGEIYVLDGYLESVGVYKTRDWRFICSLVQSPRLCQLKKKVQLSFSHAFHCIKQMLENVTSRAGFSHMHFFYLCHQ